MKALCRFLLGCLFVSASAAKAELRGVIDDPSGSTELRADKKSDAAVVVILKAGEPFGFDCERESEWCRVTIASGKTGWVERSRIRLHFTEKELPVREKSSGGVSEIEEFARGRGLDYAGVTRRAARGDPKALKQFFSLAHDADGAAAEIIAGVPTVVFHLVGDQKFAKFVAAQPVPYRMVVRNEVSSGGPLGPASLYLRRHFPETAAVLFRLEMVDWFSPDGRYAVRKVFSNEFELAGSKVVRAELIEKASGRVLCDLTADDIGAGADREGDVLWSPDSRRVACVSTDLTAHHGSFFSGPRPTPHRKQTAVYQMSGDSFVRVDLSLDEVPGRKEDKELERAVLGHEYVEPLRWKKPNVLILQRHEYYQVLKPLPDSEIESIHDLGRLYEITITISPDGKASAAWKLRADR